MFPKVTAAVNARLDELASTCGLFACVETYADDCNDPAVTYKFILGYDENLQGRCLLRLLFRRRIYWCCSTGCKRKLRLLYQETLLCTPLGYSGTITDPASGVVTDAYTLA